MTLRSALRIVVIALLACLTAAPVVAQDPGDLFDEVVAVLVKRFHDKELRRELPDIAAAYRPYARDAHSLMEEREIVHHFLGQIPSSHLAIYSAYTHKVMTRELTNRDSPTFGLKIVDLDGIYFVAKILEGSPAEEAGLLRGDRVLEIDGKPVVLSPRLDWRTDDAHLPDPPIHDLVCKKNDTVELLVERRPGDKSLIRIDGRQYSAWQAAKASIRVLEEEGARIGYLHFWYFHMQGMDGLLARAIKERFRGCEGLIIDMRGRGGSAYAVQVLLAKLSGEDRIWDGPLVVLVDGGSRSAKEVFAYEFKKQKLGVLVGEKTAGAVIPATFAKVGQDTVLMFPSFTLGNYTRLLEFQGVEPDVEQADHLPYAAGRDPILLAGVSTILVLAEGREATGARIPAAAPRTPLEEFRAIHHYRNPEKWFALEVLPSVVTETPRRIYFEKEAVTRALLAHAGGEGFDAAPMRYPDGTVFVAESLDGEGQAMDTEVLIVRSGQAPDFRLFDTAGKADDTFHQPNDPPGGPTRGNVPQVCIGCHAGSSYFDPMMSFPTEPESRRIVLDPRYRDADIVTKFLEGYHRGDGLFGPYGAIWLSKLKADAREGTLTAADKNYFDTLRGRYAAILAPVETR